MRTVKSKPKQDPSLYDSEGRWVREREQIKGAIRRAFRLSPQMKEAMEAARVELPPLNKKDGTPGKKIRVRYRCADCGELFSQKYVRVDHIAPVVPLHLREEIMSYTQIARGIFCGINNLQVLCSTPIKLLPKGVKSCHTLKTNEENYIRKKLNEIPNLLEIIKADSSFLPNKIVELEKDFKVYLEEKEKKKRSPRPKK